MTDVKYIQADDGRRFKCENVEWAICPGFGGQHSYKCVWGYKWDASKQRWQAEKNLYYVNSYVIIKPKRAATRGRPYLRRGG